MEKEGEVSIIPTIGSAQVMDNTLVAPMKLAGKHKRGLVVFDLTTGAKKEFEADNLQFITPYEQGQLLALRFDGTAFDNSPAPFSQIGLISAENGKFTPLGQLPYRKMYGLAYSPQEGKAYMTGGGEVFAWSEDQGFTLVNDMPLFNQLEEGGFLLGDD